MKKMFYVLLLVAFPSFALAQINSQGSDLVFTTSDSEVARITTSNVLEISGALKIKNTSATCDGSTAGVLRYNDVSNTAELCDGTDWNTLQYQ